MATSTSQEPSGTTITVAPDPVAQVARAIRLPEAAAPVEPSELRARLTPRRALTARLQRDAD